jgi:glycosyltransferase involved in cell wall biosynthesis
MDKYRVGIVIPALNESSTIANIIEAVKKYGVPIVVDDGSTDNTAKLALESGACVVKHQMNQGYDAALNTGFKKAAELGVQIIITLDADGQHNPQLVEKFIEAIDSGADMVVGVRSNRQRLAEHLFAWYTTIRFGVEDPLCGMKAYRAKLYQALGHFDVYGSVGTELMIYAVKNNYKISQLYFHVIERSDNSRFGKTLSANCKIIRAMLLSI